MLRLSPVVLFIALFMANSTSPKILSQLSIPSVNFASSTSSVNFRYTNASFTSYVLLSFTSNSDRMLCISSSTTDNLRHRLGQFETSIPIFSHTSTSTP
uniref:Putative secreted protein n=1 Tax=Xenopsylla cheopis TaxID=163159 RepID=A0A6M2E0F7_XENCH